MTQGEESAAFRLVGRKLKNGWTVTERVELPEDHTGGAFSVGYRAVHSSGDQGFLKAFDYAAALDADDPPEELRRLTDAYLAEKTVLEHCGDHRFSRVVRVLDADTTREEGVPQSVVSYLLFEWADRDARTVVAEADPADHRPMISLSHHAAVGMRQLHSDGIAHQDIKPSNLLVVSEHGGPIGKLGDLGSAFMRDRPAPQDELVIAGAAAYASPEQLYGCERRVGQENWRFAADVFMFGNLVVFLLIGIPYNALLQHNLDESQHWKNWSGSFDDILPALLDGHGRAISSIRDALHIDVAEPMAALINDLCQPDPDRRGDNIARLRNQNPFNLARCITRLDLIYRRSALRRQQTA